MTRAKMQNLHFMIRNLRDVPNAGSSVLRSGTAQLRRCATSNVAFDFRPGNWVSTNMPFSLPAPSLGMNARCSLPWYQASAHAWEVSWIDRLPSSPSAGLCRSLFGAFVGTTQSWDSPAACRKDSSLLAFSLRPAVFTQRAAPSGDGIVPSVRRLIGFSAGRATSNARLRCQPGEPGKCPVEGYSHEAPIS